MIEELYYDPFVVSSTLAALHVYIMPFKRVARLQNGVLNDDGPL